ncbi:MAG: hypothetical protein ABSD75_20625 [Terriglobales bacterium]
MTKERQQNTRLARSAFAAVILLLSPIPSIAKESTKAKQVTESAEAQAAVLWSSPTEIASRDLFYGPGGKEHEPHTRFTFLGEDLNGTNPKFDVRDENGVKWRVKLGPEVRPEIAASRLLWAVGYSANEDYFLSDLRVEHMQRLKRGQKLVGLNGLIHDVRLKRYVKDDRKVGEWKWQQNPFTGTREFNGLRVMMALLNNWDLKDQNNSIDEQRSGNDHDRVLQYLVSDLGASFGTTGISFPIKDSKGNLRAYAHSKFIQKVNGQHVDFNVPSMPSLLRLVNIKGFVARLHLRWIGRNIPRADARWMGELLSQLSAQQIRDAFRAAGYSPEQVEQFTEVVRKRTAELQQL